MTIRQAIQLGVEHHQAGRLPEAEQIYRRVLKAEPGNPDALYLLGVVAHQVGSHESAVQLMEEAIRLSPSNPHFHNDLGEAFRALRRPEEALTSYDRALAIKPDYADALDNRGLALQELKRCEEALASYDKALAIEPDFAEALNNRGNALQDLKRYEDALASYEKALAIKPDFAKAASNRGVVLEELRRYEEALASYDRALAIKPDYAEALDNRGLALYELKRYEEALACYEAALAIKPDLAQALYHRGNALNELKRYEEALASYNQALVIEPDYAVAHASSVHLRQQLCDWAGLAPEFQALRERLAHHKSGDIAPFILLALPGIQPGEQLLSARRFAEEVCGAALSCPPLCASTRGQADAQRLRIGYLSADFREHPVSQLVAETIELHDRNRFEVFGYSYGVDDQSSLRRRLQSAFDTFRDVATMSDGAAARLILEDRVQILVDLTGYTRNARLAITALRPAPVQVSWLGYPGTLGHARLADYLIGDAIVSPLAHSDYFSETLALMPHCFQPNDRRREIGERPTREAVGLPPEGFVFCCFNQSFKLNAQMFDVWCRLLAAVPGSVLWLLGETTSMRRNLQQEAQDRGISKDRLIFAPRVAPAQHLARLQVADLFLDTLPCNAGATGSDALWAGVPLVTCIGEAFVARYAASLLHAAGVPELITYSLQEYEALSLKLATDANRLAQIRAKLAANRPTCALFDSTQFTRDLEGLLQSLWTDHRAGRKRNIVVGQ
jgi:predicted O-linked N-acetylglucosamine transferase (SPINDLY family)